MMVLKVLTSCRFRWSLNCFRFRFLPYYYEKVCHLVNPVKGMNFQETCYLTEVNEYVSNTNSSSLQRSSNLQVVVKLCHKVSNFPASFYDNILLKFIGNFLSEHESLFYVLKFYQGNDIHRKGRCSF